MPYRIVLDGLEIFCDTAEEVADLIRVTGAPASQTAISSSFGGQKRRPRTFDLSEPRGESVVRPEVDHDPADRSLEDLQKAIEFLTELGLKPRGVPSDLLTSKLRMASSRGLGPRALLVRNVLSQLGYDPDDVFEIRGEGPNKLWAGGAQLETARRSLKVYHGRLKKLLEERET